jgi:hypothetical protein
MPKGKSRRNIGKRKWRRHTQANVLKEQEFEEIAE